METKTRDQIEEKLLEILEEHGFHTSCLNFCVSSLADYIEELVEMEVEEICQDLI